MTQAVKRYIQANKKRFLSELSDYLRIPSVSTLPQHAPDMQRAVGWLTQHLKKIGLENVQVIRTDGFPVVTANWLHAKNQPTVLIYGHYDVQPADPLNEWQQKDPFKAVIKDGAIYARGATDNKGQHFVHLKAIETLLQVNKCLPVNVKLILEGEEEIGSVHAAQVLRTHRDLFKADVAMLSDGPWISPAQPVVYMGMRGIMGGEIEVSVADGDMHSGQYGGLLPNAAMELSGIIAQLKDLKTNKVLVPHFYDLVKDTRDYPNELNLKDGFDKAQVLSDTGVKDLLCETGFLPRISGTLRPTLDINGLVSGYTQSGSKTIIPAKALAKFTCRLVLDQDPNTIFKLIAQHVQALAKDRPVQVTVKKTMQGLPAYLGSSTLPALSVALQSIETAFSKKPIVTTMGGFIGMVSHFKSELAIDTLLMDIGLPNDHMHAPNEKLDLEQFEKGILMSTLFLNGMRKD